MLSSESASHPHHLPLLYFPSLSNTEINIGYLLGGSQRQPGSGQASPSYPAFVGMSLRSRWLCTIWVPSLDSPLYRRVERVLIGRFTIMNGTAWRCSHSEFHLSPYSVNVTPHDTPFFFLFIPHSVGTKKVKDIERPGKVWWKWRENRHRGYRGIIS